MRWISSKRPGQWSLIFSFLILLAAAIFLPQEWGRYQSATEQVDRSQEIIETTQDFLSALKDAESGQRGYLLARDPQYLEPYRQAVNSVPKLLDQLGTLCAGIPSLQLRYDKLAALAQAKMAELETTLDLARTHGFPAALAEVRTDRGQEYMDQIRRAAADMDRQQSENLAAWSNHAERLSERTFGLTLLAVISLFFFLLTATLSSWRIHQRELQLIQTERSAQNALLESESRFRSMADAATVMIWAAGTDNKRTYFNKGWLEFTGRTFEQEAGDGWLQGVHPEDAGRMQAVSSNAADKREPFTYEYRLRRHDGEYRWVTIQGIPRYLMDGEFIGYVGSGMDSHDRKTLEEDLERRVQERTEELRYKEAELLQSRKLEAIGRLAGGVAHDFNNMLTGITGVAESIRSDLKETDSHRQDLDEILKAAGRASSLTKQLLALGRRQIAAPIVLNLNTLLTEMTGMLKRLIGEDIQFTTMLSPEVGNVRMDPGQLEQIVINLVLNSRDAMPHGGKISVETANAELDETYAKKHFAVVAGPYILLAISDTGVGMDQATQEHVFEPFFTTKADGRGSGLGLATVYGIVKQNSGDIFLYSTPGAGTTFKIYLPRVTEPVAAAPVRMPQNAKGTETVLLVEDEDIVRRTASRALGRCGYKVLEAKNGKEALEIAASFGESIHLLLTDVIMPGLNGRQLAELLGSERREMKVLYMSGYTENIIVQRGMLKPGIAFIEKSFTSAGLCGKVREVLDMVNV